MKFKAKSLNKDFEIPDAGSFTAICTGVIELGLQKGSPLYPDSKHQVYLRFELPTELVTYQKEGQSITAPMSVGRTFTASMNEKSNLRKFVEGWFGKTFKTDEAAEAFDFKAMLGRRAMVNIMHNTAKTGKVYANLVSASPLPKGMVSEEPQHNPSLYYDLANEDEKVLSSLPKWLQEKIRNRLEEEVEVEEVVLQSDEPFNDDIPF
jgi:hypothetical protein